MFAFINLAAAECRETLAADDYTDEEIAAEVTAILAQQGYVLHAMGREQEAMDRYNEILDLKPDPVVYAVVGNNVRQICVVCVGIDFDIFGEGVAGEKGEGCEWPHRPRACCRIVTPFFLFFPSSCFIPPPLPVAPHDLKMADRVPEKGTKAVRLV